MLFAPAELDHLIANFVALRGEPDQHFHISTSGDDGPFVDLEIGVDPAHSSNATVFGMAIDPDPGP